jgi:general secretion pathway protein D
MEQPFFHTRSVSTSISIYNGATVVMGGMINEVRKTVDDKIPLLGDIPLVGRFFQSRHEVSDKRNLLIFVTARLVDPAGRPIERSGEDIASRIATKPGTGSSTFGATGTTIGGAVPAPAVTP